MSADSNKDETITRMLNELRATLGDHTFDVVDHWESDRCAIGVARPDNHGVLVYVSTYERGQNEYWVSLELPSERGEGFPYEPAGELQVRGIQQLASVVRSHLGAKSA